MRVETATGQHSQQIEQLKALAANIPRQAPTKPADDSPREVATPRSIRPKAEPIEGKLNAQRSKLLSDVFKLADVSVKFSAPKTDFADFLAQKSDELTQLSNRLSTDNVRFAKEFVEGVNGLGEQYAEDGANIADAKATFEDDDRNIQDTHANNEADADEIMKLHQNFMRDSANVQAFQDDFGEDSQNVNEFNKNFREDSATLQDFQANFVEDSQNVGEFQRNFVEDRTNVEKFQNTFVEDKANNSAFRQDFQEDVHEIGRHQQNFVEDKDTLFQFSEQYGGESTKISSFREAYDREVDSIDRLQNAADLQKSMLSERSAQTSSQPTKPSNVPSDVRAFAAEFAAKSANTSRNGLSLTEAAPQRSPGTASNTPAQSPLADPLYGRPPASIPSSPFSPQATRPVGNLVAKQPTQMPFHSAASRATAVPLATNQPIDPSVDATVRALPRAPQATTPVIGQQQNVSRLSTASTTTRQTAPIPQQSQYEPDIFQLAGLLAMQMATSAPAPASVNHSDIAKTKGGQAGDLKSGFSFLSHTAKKDDRRKHADDEDEEDRQ